MATYARALAELHADDDVSDSFLQNCFALLDDQPPIDQLPESSVETAAVMYLVQVGKRLLNEKMRLEKELQEQLELTKELEHRTRIAEAHRRNQQSQLEELDDECNAYAKTQTLQKAQTDKVLMEYEHILREKDSEIRELRAQVESIRAQQQINSTLVPERNRLSAVNRYDMSGSDRDSSCTTPNRSLSDVRISESRLSSSPSPRTHSKLVSNLSQNDLSANETLLPSLVVSTDQQRQSSSNGPGESIETILELEALQRENAALKEKIAQMESQSFQRATEGRSRTGSQPLNHSVPDLITSSPHLLTNGNDSRIIGLLSNVGDNSGHQPVPMTSSLRSDDPTADQQALMVLSVESSAPAASSMSGAGHSNEQTLSGSFEIFEAKPLKVQPNLVDVDFSRTRSADDLLDGGSTPRLVRAGVDRVMVDAAVQVSFLPPRTAAAPAPATVERSSNSGRRSRASSQQEITASTIGRTSSTTTKPHLSAASFLSRCAGLSKKKDCQSEIELATYKKNQTTQLQESADERTQLFLLRLIQLVTDRQSSSTSPSKPGVQTAASTTIDQVKQPEDEHQTVPTVATASPPTRASSRRSSAGTIEIDVKSTKEKQRHDSGRKSRPVRQVVTKTVTVHHFNNVTRSEKAVQTPTTQDTEIPAPCLNELSTTTTATIKSADQSDDNSPYTTTPNGPATCHTCWAGCCSARSAVGCVSHGTGGEVEREAQYLTGVVQLRKRPASQARVAGSASCHSCSFSRQDETNFYNYSNTLPVTSSPLSSSHVDQPLHHSACLLGSETANDKAQAPSTSSKTAKKRKRPTAFWRASLRSARSEGRVGGKGSLGKPIGALDEASNYNRLSRTEEEMRRFRPIDDDSMSGSPRIGIAERPTPELTIHVTTTAAHIGSAVSSSCSSRSSPEPKRSLRQRITSIFGCAGWSHGSEKRR